MIYGTIICFGDSLTFGARDEYGLSYPVELGRELTKDGQLWNTVNLGISGETTADMLRRSYKEVINYPEAKEVILLAGTNDAKNNISVEMFKSNYEALVRDFIILGKRVYQCTIPLKNGFGSVGYFNNINKIIKEYNKVIRKLYDSGLLIELEYLSKEFFIDGIHFNHDGNIEVANIIANKIREIR